MTILLTASEGDPQLPTRVGHIAIIVKDIQATLTALSEWQRDKDLGGLFVDGYTNVKYMYFKELPFMLELLLAKA